MSELQDLHEQMEEAEMKVCIGCQRPLLEKIHLKQGEKKNAYFLNVIALKPHYLSSPHRLPLFQKAGVFACKLPA